MSDSRNRNRLSELEASLGGRWVTPAGVSRRPDRRTIACEAGERRDICRRSLAFARWGGRMPASSTNDPKIKLDSRWTRFGGWQKAQTTHFADGGLRPDL